MTGGFVARDGVIYRALSEQEATVLRGLVGGLLRTLEEGDAADPVLRRLAPDAYAADEADASAEFAGFTRERILDGKRERLLALAADAEKDGIIALDRDAAQIWLLAINDLRLALAERIGHDRLTADDDPTGDVYDWLGWLQSGLVDAVQG